MYIIIISIYIKYMMLYNKYTNKNIYLHNLDDIVTKGLFINQATSIQASFKNNSQKNKSTFIISLATFLYKLKLFKYFELK